MQRYTSKNAPFKYKGSLKPIYGSQRKVVRKAAQTAVRRLAETKYHDAALNVSATDASTVYPLTDIATGTTDITRLGDNVSVKSLQFRWAIYSPTVSPDISNVVRFIIWQHVDYIAGTPAPSTLLSNTYLGTINGPQSPFKHDNKSMFRVLYDSGQKTIALNGKTAIAGKVYLPLYKMAKCVKKVKWAAGSTVNGYNRLFVQIISDSSAVGHPVFDCVSRFHFTDT